LGGHVQDRPETAVEKRAPLKKAISMYQPGQPTAAAQNRQQPKSIRGQQFQPSGGGINFYEN